MTSATNEDDVLSDSQLDTVVGGHKSGPSNYNKKNATLPLPQPSTNSTPLLAALPWGMMAEQPKAQGSKGQGHC
jgi:hypothetical protein